MKKTAIIIVSLLAAVAAAAAGYFVLRPRPLNVVLISIDTLRPDHLGCYGYGRDTSPTIDGLARDGAVFTTAVSTTSWTLPAHAALFTSLPDNVHRVLWDTDALDPARETLAEIFRAHGYRTAGVFTGPYLLPRFGLDQGFEQYLDATLFDKRLADNRVLVASEAGRTTPVALDRALAWLARDDDRPFFLFLHLFDVHPDFDPPPPFDTMFDPDYRGDIHGRDVFHNPRIKKDMDPADLQNLVALYDGEIRFVDQAGVKRLLDFLRRRGDFDHTLIVIVADHGEEFFEHGEFGHRHNLYDTTVRVPIIIRGPGVTAGARLQAQARLIDVMPTILELVGLPPAAEALGRSLVPAMSGGELDPDPAALEITGGALHLEGFREDRLKFIIDYKNKKTEIYRLDSDPAEGRPLEAEAAPEAVRRYQAIFAALKKCSDSVAWTGTGKARMDDETRKRLESLGYVNH